MIPEINTLACMFTAISGIQFLLFGMWFDMEYNRELRVGSDYQTTRNATRRKPSRGKLFTECDSGDGKSGVGEGSVRPGAHGESPYVASCNESSRHGTTSEI